ncbi:MAG: HAMP domain-containing protein [Phycisphaeraceae bacterium]|nr:HAMP domain-containing protein [Phycisphaeraceae bacterium]
MPQRAANSFQRRLLWVLATLAVASAGLTSAMLIFIHYVSVRNQAEADLETQVRVVAAHSQAALSFGDTDTGRETLAAFRAAPDVAWAVLYDQQGNPFAEYAPGNTAVPARVDQITADFHDSRLVLSAPVVKAEQVLGTVVVAYDLQTIYGRLRDDILLSAAAALVVLGAAILLALRLRRTLARPVHELVGTALRVSQQDIYSARAQKYTNDELGRLTDTFNHMLDRIEEQRRELSHQNKQMQQFLYTVSHDLKGPLVTITGFVGILREDLIQRQYEQVDASLTHIVRASQHMSNLIDSLLTLSRIGRVPHQVKTIDTAELVSEITDDLSPRLQEVDTRIVIHRPMPTVTADRVRLRQVFENLLINAIKYGKIAAGAPIEIGGENRPGEVRLYVRDHGPGIADEHRERVFLLFQRLDRSHDGTGVGLAIVAKVAEMHGGRAWMEPTPGGGATFWFALPQPPTVTDIPADNGDQTR